MIIDVTEQIKISPAIPLKRGATYTGSALPVAIVGIPERHDDGSAITAVAITLTNADGAALTAQCTRGVDGIWRTAYDATCFAAYGYVAKGIKIVTTLAAEGGVTYYVTIAVGDLEILADSADAAPGDPTAHYQQKGADIYLKSTVEDGVQHYKKQVLAYDDEMAAWGLDWTGDYILVNGDFIPYQP